MRQARERLAARWLARVVLPSPPMALVTRITRAPSLRGECISTVRMASMASVMPDRASSPPST